MTKLNPNILISVVAWFSFINYVVETVRDNNVDNTDFAIIALFCTLQSINWKIANITKK